MNLSRSDQTREAAAGEMLAVAAALDLAGSGVPVFPCVPSAKRPVTAQGFKDASVDAERIEAWWTQVPAANIAMPTGEPSGRLVLDLDGEQGAQTLAALVARHGELPAGPRVKTPRGMHHHFSDPGGQRNTAGKLGPGVDTRSDGGYVVLPPSKTADGAYEWQDPELPLPPVPEWLLGLLRAPAASNGNGAPRTNGTANGNAPADAAPIIAGQRNAALASLAGGMRRCGDDAKAIEAELAKVNASRCQPPLDAGEVARIAASIARYAPTTDKKGKALLAALPGQQDRQGLLEWLNATLGLDAQHPATGVAITGAAGSAARIEIHRQGTAGLVIEPAEATDVPRRLASALTWGGLPGDTVAPTLTVPQCAMVGWCLRALGDAANRTTANDEARDVLDAHLGAAQAIEDHTIHGDAQACYQAAKALQGTQPDRFGDDYDPGRYLIDANTAEIIIRVSDLHTAARRVHGGALPRGFLEGRLTALGWRRVVIEGHEQPGRAGRRGPRARCIAMAGFPPVTT